MVAAAAAVLKSRSPYGCSLRSLKRRGSRDGNSVYYTNFNVARPGVGAAAVFAPFGLDLNTETPLWVVVAVAVDAPDAEAPPPIALLLLLLLLLPNTKCGGLLVSDDDDDAATAAAARAAAAVGAEV